MANLVLPGSKFQLSQTIIDTKSLLDETNFYHQKQGAPSELTKKLTYILGKNENNYPLSMMTMGGEGFGNNNTTKEIDDVQFTYPVIGQLDKANVTFDTIYTGSDKPGIANSPFYLIFPDNYIKRFTIIQSEGGTQAYTLEEGEPLPTGGFRYKVQLDPAGPSDWCPVPQTYAGVKWVRLHTAVPESESRTTESNMAVPGAFKNQMGFMRTGFSWAGNAANKIMKITVTGKDGKSTEVWMDWFMWQFEQQWLADCEHYYWYSRYNRLPDGTIPLKDMLTGKTIPRTSGVLEQIANRSSYSKLTYQTLVNKVGDALFGQNDSGNMTITLMGGRGARRELDRIIREAGGMLLGNNWGNIADRFVTGTGYNMMLGGFFDGFYHIDGYTIKFKHNPIFDTGRVAKASPLHPESGLPLESYRMVFIDDSDVDGQPNIMHVAQKGRGYMDGVVAGLTPMPKSLQILSGNQGLAASKFLSTDQDKSSYVRFKSAGIQILRANRCFDLTCVAGL
jgi:hypothetical protein